MGEGAAMTTSVFISSITGALTDFSIANLSSIIVAALGITVGLVVAWFAYRFISRKVAKAMRSGSL